MRAVELKGEAQGIRLSNFCSLPRAVLDAGGANLPLPALKFSPAASTPQQALLARIVRPKLRGGFNEDTEDHGSVILDEIDQP
jgi:hypothetical protein